MVRDTYQIMMYMETPSLVWIQVGEECFYDDVNGVLRSNCLVHRVTVPQDKLDAHGQYTVCRRKMIERKTGHSWTGEIDEVTFVFHPVRGEKVRAYHIADSHNWVEDMRSIMQIFRRQTMEGLTTPSVWETYGALFWMAERTKLMNIRRMAMFSVVMRSEKDRRSLLKT